MGDFLMKAYENSSKDKLKQCSVIMQFTSLTGCLDSMFTFRKEKKSKHKNNKTPKYRKKKGGGTQTKNKEQIFH